MHFFLMLDFSFLSKKKIVENAFFSNFTNLSLYLFNL